MRLSNQQPFLLVIILLFCYGCEGQKEERENFSYDLSNPVKKCILPPELNEISGLALLDSSNLLCHNDEEGILFNYNVLNDTIENQWAFGKDRDYEGVTKKGSDAYVVASDGDIVKVAEFQDPEKRTATKFENELDKGNNVEGLCFLQESNALLLACKDDPGNGLPHQKALYAFDLASKKLQASRPLITIGLKVIEEAIINNPLDKISNSLRKAFALDEDQTDLFRPSGVALHPITGELYVLSAKYAMLVILDRQYNFKKVVPFRQSYFQQPEGITFGKNGDLFISNEANDAVPNILWFEYKGN